MIETHILYDKYKSQWVRIRDVIEGQDAIKDKGITYLPKLSGQNNEEYLSFKQRALFISITERIVRSNVGMITRRNPIITKPSSMDYIFDGSINNKSFFEIFKYTVSELLQLGRVALLVDVRENKPVILRYSTESILNWYKNKKGQLIDIILKTDTIETMGELSEISYYHLKLRNNVYSIDELDDAGTSMSTTIPTIRGKTISYIPFICMTTTGIDIEPTKSPIINIVNINLSHYMSSADLENGRHYTALPTPIVTGSVANKDLRIGSSVAWVLPDVKSKAFFLEFQGQGLLSLEKALSEKQSQMSQFNADLMDTSTRGSEAENIVKLRHSADATSLSDIADIVELGLNYIYKIAALFLGEKEEVNIEIYKDFLSMKLSHAELSALSKAYLDGSIDQQTFMYNLQRGEILKPAV